MVKRVVIVVLLLPVAEIAVFLLVAALIGFLGAFTLMVATTLAGVVVLRQAGRGRIARFRVAVSDAEITGTEVNAAGFLTVLAGFLLVLPGFLTDLVGAALLIGPVRRWCGRTFQSWTSSWISRKQHGEPGVIDLAPSEWQQVPDREIEHTKKPPRKRRKNPREKPRETPPSG